MYPMVAGKWVTQEDWDQVQAAAAEMRAFIAEYHAGHSAHCNYFTGRPCSCIKTEADHALSSDAGKGWRSPEEWERLQAASTAMRSTLTAIRNILGTDGWEGQQRKKIDEVIR